MQKSQFKEFLISPIGKAIILIAGMVIIYGIIVACLASSSMAVFGIALVACAVFGWKALNKITPDIFLFMSIGGWAIYFLIKGLLSAVIGAFVAPFQISKMVTNAITSSLNDDGNE